MSFSEFSRKCREEFCVAHAVLFAVYIICVVCVVSVPVFYDSYNFRLHYADGGSDQAQLFYDTGAGYNESESVIADVTDGNADFILDDGIRENAVSYRIDPIGGSGEMELPLESLSVVINGEEIISYRGKAFQELILSTNHISDIRIIDGNVTLSVTDIDPYFFISDKFTADIPKAVQRYNHDIAVFYAVLLSIAMISGEALLFFRKKIAAEMRTVKQSFVKVAWVQKYILPTADKLTVFGKLLYIFSAVLFAAAVIVFTVGRFLLENFNGLSMEEIVFHLKVPMKGTGSDMIAQYFRFSKVALIASGVLLAAVVILLALWKNIRNNRFIRMLSVLFALCLFLLSVFDVSRALELPKYIAAQMSTSSFIEENYAAPDKVSLTFPETKRNLIYIYLESMESTFISKQDGGCMETDMIPELTRLAQENINFSESELAGGATSSAGSTWTIGAMTAQSAGIPLLIPIGANDYGEYQQFLPGAVSLGDILHENGYEQEIMVGSDLSFGGRRNFYTQHGDYQVYDLFTARKREDLPDDYNVWWGYEDAKLFSYAKEEILKLAGGDNPFNFTMLTVDTHHIGGYVCELCRNEHQHQYENVLSCSSRQVASFVEWIQEQDFYDNTTVIICGDHPSMDASYIEVAYDNSKPRKVYNCFVNAVGDAVNSKNREFNTFDFFPTILAAMGCEISGEHLGLGTNLFSGERTLAERYGYAKIDEEFSRTSPFYRKQILQE